MKSLVVASAVLLSALAAPALAAPAQPLAVLKLEPYRKTVAVRTTINGREGRFVFDTGGGDTLVSPEFARAIGCEPWGRLTGYNMMGERIDTPRCENLTVKAGPLDLKVATGGVLDVTSLFPAGAEPLDGLLALDAFDGRAVTIDATAGRLVVESPESLKARIAGAKEVPIVLKREGVALAVELEVPTAKGPVRMELDTGNGGTILVSKPYAALLGMDPERKDAQPVAFEAAPGVPVKGVGFTPDMIIDGNLGMPFLRDWAVTVDFARGRAWLTPTGS